VAPAGFVVTGVVLVVPPPPEPPHPATPSAPSTSASTRAAQRRIEGSMGHGAARGKARRGPRAASSSRSGRAQVPCYPWPIERLSLAPEPLHDDDLSRASALARALVEACAGAVRAPRATLEACVVCLMAGGHLMIEDVPGVGKTVLA